MMYPISLIIGILSFFPMDNFHKDYSFHSVAAEKGDGVYSLLRRYKLADDYCNIEEFFKLNELSKDQHLKVGTDYVLPVYIYKYDGKSIRSTVGISDWNQAVRIKAFNEFLVESKLRQAAYHDSKILWVPHHELKCGPIEEKTTKTAEPAKVSPTVKAEKKKKVKKEMLQIDLFGDKEANIEVVDKALSGQVFYIVAGHGGPDPGAVCEDHSSSLLCEDEYAYDVSLRLARDLMQHGAKVEIVVQDPNDGIRDGQILDCDRDERYVGGAKIHSSQKKRLRKRAEIINSLFYKYRKQGYKKQTAVMIHVDSRNKKQRQDVFFYYYKNSQSSKELAYNVHETFKKKYAKFQKNRGYHGYVDHRNLYMLKNTLPTALFVELANIRNHHDHERLLLESNREALAKWLFEGLIKS